MLLSVKVNIYMPLIGNSMEPEKTGKSGVNNRICQFFYSISEEEIYKQTWKNEFVNRSKVSQTRKKGHCGDFYRIYAFIMWLLIFTFRNYGKQ